MLVVSETNQIYQNDALSNQLTDFSRGVRVILNLLIFERATRQSYKPIKREVQQICLLREICLLYCSNPCCITLPDATQLKDCAQ
jgi:hypothetical protein